MDWKLAKAVGKVIVIAWILARPQIGLAQQASIQGTVIDESKAVLPGVTVTATAVETGRQFTDISNETGDYRLVGLPAGRYNLQAELPGFGSTVLSNIELLVGQNASFGLTMKVAANVEEVTVTGEVPLVDSQQAHVAANVDTRQMQEIPIAGRNWQQLATLVKGVTMNTMTTRPGTNRDAAFLLNLDGQNITNTASHSGFGQPIISRDAIAEYQIITNLFDVTMGRSTGMQVQAISKSGSNQTHGTFYGYFRDSRFNAPDAYAHKVLPYSNQQVGGTMGGPIIKDKMQYFVAYEGERAPNTIILTPSALAGQRFDLPTENDQRKPLARFDYQINPKDHLTTRWGASRSFTTRSVSSVPSAAVSQLYDSNYVVADWSHAASSTVLHDLKVNYFQYHWYYGASSDIPGSVYSGPTYSFPGLSLGTPSNYPQDWHEKFVTTRYDLAWHNGSHDLKIGSELRLGKDTGTWYKGTRGTMAFSKLPADATTRFPASAALDPSQWDLSGLDSLATTFRINYARNTNFDINRPMISGWFGDTWKVRRSLTMNYGVRYDAAWDDLISPGVKPTTILITTGYGPFGTEDLGFRDNTRDLRDIAPRLGVSFSPRSDLVIHGGSGLYFAGVSEQATDQQLFNVQNFVGNTYFNDGKPGWVKDPTRSITADQVLSGQVPLQPQTIMVIGHGFRMPYTWQNAIGFQKQLNPFMGFDADLVQYIGRNEDSQRDPNLFYNPATGLPKNPLVFGRPNPAYDSIAVAESHGRSNYMALATSFTRRYHNNFQFGITYTLMMYKHDTGVGSAGYGAKQVNTFDIMQDWATSTDFQRHTLRFNGVWSLPMGFSLSGYFGYGSANPSYATSTNVDPLGLGSTRIRSDLSVIPRANFYGDAFHTMDVHLSKDVKVGERTKMTGIAEVFNVYSHQQFTYNTLETSAAFRTRNGTAGAPRTAQLAFRVSF
jgi:carboxypeptidase family protein